MSIHSTGVSRDAPLNDLLKPLAVPVKQACRILGIGNTKMWELIGAGRVKTISIGRKRLVIFASLEALVALAAAAAPAPHPRGRRRAQKANKVPSEASP